MTCNTNKYDGGGTNVPSERGNILMCETAKWHPKKQMPHLTDGSMELDCVHSDRSVLMNATESKAYQAPNCRCF